MTPPVFHILLCLSDGERHGYGIMREVTTQTVGKLRMGPGTLYGCIKRMIMAGLAEESGERPDPELDDERRRYYRITRAGSQALREEASRMAQAVRLARSKQLLKESV
jgi:DNA-binding PadR family transcriptional regulator